METESHRRKNFPCIAGRSAPCSAVVKSRFGGVESGTGTDRNFMKVLACFPAGRDDPANRGRFVLKLSRSGIN